MLTLVFKERKQLWFLLSSRVSLKKEVIKIPCFMEQKANIKRNRSEMYFRKGVFKNFAKFTGKYLYRSVNLIKLQD